ncbi:MAG: sugar phosphate isomerase/epimerase family protein [Bryobacteraceae bacterium]
MRRRDFLALTAMPLWEVKDVRLGVDLFSLRSQGWNAFQSLEYCARLGARVIHFSEPRFLGSLEDDHLRRVAARARDLGVELEVGMRSICPSSKMFDPSQGTAEQQLGRMIHVARLLGSPIVRAVLGSMADRAVPPGIEAHIENTVRVLRAVRSQALDAGIRIAIENHAGDMQARELKALVEEAGRDWVGVCLDSGNPLWTIEDPHLTLELLAPYTLTCHLRDSAVWRVPKGAAVAWVRAGEGNVHLDEWVREFLRRCPGRTLSLEVIVTGPRVFAFLDPKFWEAYRNTPAWEFARFLALAEPGSPRPAPPQLSKEQALEREREDLEASFAWLRQLLEAPAN